MSGIGSINVPQVQLPNYDAAIRAYGNAGVDYSGLGKGIMGGLQFAEQRRMNDSQLALQEQQKQAQAMEVENKKKEFLVDTAYGISKLPEDKRGHAYDKVTSALTQRGILQPGEVPSWNEGGQDLLSQISVQSPMYLKEKEQEAAADMNKLKALKIESDIGLNSAKTAATLNPKLSQKPMAAASAVAMANFDEGVKMVQDLRSLYPTVSAPNVKGSLPRFAQSADVQKLEFLKSNLSDTIGRLRSQGAVNAQEETRFRGFFPKVGDSDSTVAYKLQKMEDLMKSASTSIRGGPADQAEDNGFAEASRKYPDITQEQFQALMRGKQ